MSIAGSLIAKWRSAGSSKMLDLENEAFVPHGVQRGN